LHACTLALILVAKLRQEVKKMRSWRVAALLFLLGLGLGLLAQAIFTPAHSQNSYEVVSLLRSIDRRLESIERRLDRIERNTDNIYRNFDYVRDWNAVRVRVVR
jgi:apolipoprotein N-acyltransferase